MLGPARLLRGWTAALTATLLAAGSHTLAGLLGGPAQMEDGHAAPSAVVWILTLALTAPICTALAGRVLSWWRLLVAVGASQLLFHGAYSLAPGHSVGTPGTAGGLPLLDPHAHHRAGALSTDAIVAVPDGAGTAAVDVLTTAPVVAAPSTLTAAPDHPLAVAMLVAHLAAALLTVVVLREGERTVLAALSWLVLERPAGLLARWRPVIPTPRVPSTPSEGLRWQPTPVLECLRLRGPPVAAVAC